MKLNGILPEWNPGTMKLSGMQPEGKPSCVKFNLQDALPFRKNRNQGVALHKEPEPKGSEPVQPLLTLHTEPEPKGSFPCIPLHKEPEPKGCGTQAE